MTSLIRIADVISITTLSRASIYRMLKDGQFPAPVRLGERRVAWRFDDIENWMTGRIGGAA